MIIMMIKLKVQNTCSFNLKNIPFTNCVFQIALEDVNSDSGIDLGSLAVPKRERSNSNVLPPSDCVRYNSDFLPRFVRNFAIQNNKGDKK